MDFSARCRTDCRQLDERVFNRPEVAEAASGYVAVRVDVDSGEGPALVERYRIAGTPTLLFLTPGGVEIDRLLRWSDEGAPWARGYDVVVGV